MKLFLTLFLLLCGPCLAAQYYVRTDGNNSNTGTANNAGGAWLTIQKAADTMVAGDTVTVNTGAYNEYVATVNAGTSGSRITYNTTGGTVYCYGFNINDAYTTVNGFTIRWNSRATQTEGACFFNQNGGNSILENCHIGPGMYLKLTDATFVDSNPDTLTSAAGGFVAAGFRAGATMRIQDSETSSDTLNDDAAYLIANVTDNTITFDGAVAVTAESNKKAFIYGATRGITFYSTVADCIVRDCTFDYAACEMVQMNGTNNTIEDCTFSHCLGFDVLLYGGTNFTLRHNVVKDSLTHEVFDPSPDSLSNIGTASGLVEENIIMDFEGALGFDHGTVGGPVTWRRNVFFNVGHGYLIKTEGAVFEHNVFYNVAVSSNPVVAAQNHVVQWVDEPSNVTTATLKGNIFIGCGNGQTSVRGWYSNAEPTLTNFTANWNYVAGASPSFGVKTGFSETNGINGGDPLFVDPSDPLGPDELPFTSDDGFRLQAGSPAIGAAESGEDMGAYDFVGSVIEAGTVNAASLIVGP